MYVASMMRAEPCFAIYKQTQCSGVNPGGSGSDEEALPPTAHGMPQRAKRCLVLTKFGCYTNIFCVSYMPTDRFASLNPPPVASISHNQSQSDE